MKELQISKKDLKYNLNLLKNNLNPNKTKIIGVVKGNGMGLDLLKYSNFLLDNGIDFLAVATTDEAIKLRENNINCKLLMLSEIANEKELNDLIENDIILTIGNLEEKSRIESIAKTKNKIVKIHIKIDTGFGRYGFLYNNLDNILNAVSNTENVKVEGVYTHFSKPIDEKWTRTQFDRFSEVMSRIRDKHNDLVFHCSNSTAFLLYPEMNLDFVRLRIMYPRKSIKKNTLGLKRIGEFKSEIVTIKEVPKGYNISYSNCFKTKENQELQQFQFGYIDGFNVKNQRDNFSFKDNIISVLMETKKVFTKPKLQVKINGRDYNVIGHLGMYHAIIDITGADNINIGEEVTLNLAPLYTNMNIRREYI